MYSNVVKGVISLVDIVYHITCNFGGMPRAGYPTLHPAFSRMGEVGFVHAQDQPKEVYSPVPFSCMKM
jgi:hypothetical protein